MEEINKISLNSGFHDFNLHKIGDPEHLTRLPEKTPDAQDGLTHKKAEPKKIIKKDNKKIKPATGEAVFYNHLSSHDLQEPLRKIQTFSSRIMEKEEPNLSESGKEYFKRMQRATARMQTILEDLHLLSKLSLGNHEFKKTDLNKIIKEVRSDLREAIAKKGAVIKCHNLVEATIIPVQFRQLLKNLVSNALKFSQPGNKIEIHISCEIKRGNKLNDELSPNKNYLHISVIDNGIGFEPQFNERIFQIFERLNGKDEYEGNGIGLAICKKIVENHRGIIKAKPNLKGGSCFDLYIPVVQA
jgi:light-regulated signal transduction histidine kinase (bacteriophytochrome)